MLDIFWCVIFNWLLISYWDFCVMIYLFLCYFVICSVCVLNCIVRVIVMWYLLVLFLVCNNNSVGCMLIVNFFIFMFFFCCSNDL